LRPTRRQGSMRRSKALELGIAQVAWMQLFQQRSPPSRSTRRRRRRRSRGLAGRGPVCVSRANVPGNRGASRAPPRGGPDANLAGRGGDDDRARHDRDAEACRGAEALRRGPKGRQKEFEEGVDGTSAVSA
jgi:hypothetical protein